MLAVDGTDIPKDGTESVGVARPYCGQLGKRANCQAAALLAQRLYLSRDWVSAESHAARRQRTGVPANTPFRTKPQLVLEMLTALTAEGVLPVRWVTCDEGFGRGHAFLDGVAAPGLGCLAEVPRITHVWAPRPEPQGGSPSRPVFSAPSQEVGHRGRCAAGRGLAALCPAGGSKGPQAILGAVLHVAARRGREPGPDVWLLLRRNPATDQFKVLPLQRPTDMSAERLVWQVGQRRPIEQCFRDGRQLFGLGDYEGRSWQGWHRHATLVMLAHFFVVREMLRLKKNSPA